ncbi:MAG: hypothetical protein PHH11_00175 [Methylomonas sp.]|nr:hypothetical protein [Methylomonas sp.]
MDTCYRGMPKFVGALFETLYQHPTALLITVIALTAMAGTWWFKAGKKPE